MKKNFIKVVSALIVSTMVSTSCAVTTLASTNVNTNKLQQNYGRNNSKKYSMGDLNRYSNQQLVDLICQIKWNDISDLFKYNGDSYAFYANKQRVQALIDALHQKAQQYTPDDDKGIPTLVEVLRSGFYLGYYNKSLKYMNDRKFQDKCIPAMIAIENNKNFSLGKEGQNRVIESMGKFIGNASCNVDVVNRAVPILNDYYNNVDADAKDRTKGSAIFELMKGIEYDINQYAYNHKIRDGKNTPWSGKIDNFINAISKFASVTKLTDDNKWLVNNGIYYTGKFAKYHSDSKIPHTVIDNGLKNFDYLGEQYFTALDRELYDFGSKNSQGNKIDIEKIKEDGKKHYLPKTYTFDNGKMVIKTGDKVTQQKVQRLYWASKEVKSQFIRTIGNDKALEKGNPDDVLTMVIYNNPDEYKLNRILYGYSTDNGGMYVEGVGTFFTYERTPQQSIYTLEELFRHEFTHYLQGRYLVPGIWGRSDFYKGNASRLTWFEEGTAEFFAGSTRKTVLSRKSMVSGISRNARDRFSISKTVHSKYDDGWDFYKYGFALSDYMYNDNKNLFMDLVDYIKSNDVKGYEKLVEDASRNTNIEQAYEHHMQDLVDEKNKLIVPLVSDDYMKKYDIRSLEQIKTDIEKVSGLKGANIVKEKAQFFDTYTLKGKYVLPVSKGKIADWKNVNVKVNDDLKKLQDLSWGGYKTVTAYFANRKVNESKQVEYDVVFHGLLSHNKNFNEEPTVKINVPETAKVGEKVKLSSEGSKDDGKIVSYVWNFGDGTTSTELNPMHIYIRAGKYNVKLTVKDDKGLNVEKEVEIKIIKELKGKVVFEKEDNGSYEKANKVYSGELVTASIGDSDKRDVYSFDVTKPSNIDITLEKNDGKDDKLNWLVYSAKKSDKYIGFANKREKNRLSGTVKVDKPGKYYLVVYHIKGDKIDYKFNVDGLNGNTKPDTIVNEKENNDSFDKANQICAKQIVNGNVGQNDGRDTYYFDVLNPGNVNITLTKKDNSYGKCNWIVYSADDTCMYIAYGNKTEGNKALGSFKAKKPGRYYVVVYKTVGNKTNYQLSVDGLIGKTIDKPPVNEKENNNSFDKANKINLDTTVLAQLDSQDDKDVFSFNVENDKDLDVTLRNLNNLGMTWVLYNKSDLHNYISYGQQKGTSITNKVHVKPGKYYLYVYSTFAHDFLGVSL